MITSHSVPVSWDGMFAKRGSFADRFDVKDVQHNEDLDLYSVTVVFKKSPDSEYTFEVKAENYSTDKQVLATEILRQLQTGA